MFTGLIRHLGTVASVAPIRRGLRLTLRVPPGLGRLRRGDSLAVQGICLTVERAAGLRLTFTAVPETLSRTTLGSLRPGDRVHLERPLRAAERLHGHIVQGHVDGVGIVVRVGAWERGKVEARDRAGTARRFDPRTHAPTHPRTAQSRGTVIQVRIPRALRSDVVPKGSIALDGVSLTVASLRGNLLTVALIPETLRKTRLGRLPPGGGVNVETDVLAKLAGRRIGRRRP